MKPIQKYLSVILSITLMSLSFNSAQAALVTNELIISQVQQHSEKARLLQTIKRLDVKQQLLSMGVKAEDIERRVEQLTPEEVAQLNQQIDELPAGGDLLGVILIIFIIFIITDVIGATDIFPFIKSVN